MVEHRHSESGLFALQPAAFTSRQVQFDALCFLRYEFAIDIGGQLMRNVSIEHRYLFVRAKLFNRSASILWPLLKREATVPIEQCSTCAIWS